MATTPSDREYADGPPPRFTETAICDILDEWAAGPWASEILPHLWIARRLGCSESLVRKKRARIGR